MDITEMKKQIERVETATRRGLLSPFEAEERITELINDTFSDIAYTTAAKWKALMNERRQAQRRKWRFLLEMSKDPERCC